MITRRRALVAILTVAVLGYLLFGRSESITYKSAPVKRGTLRVSISATGTVEPEETIDVGAQVAGIILSFGKDSTGNVIDFGSEVEEGTVLAQIDDSLYRADLQRDQALLENARANLQLARAKFSQAERNWIRVEKLGKSNAISPSEFDTYRLSYEEGKASMAVADAAIKQAEAALGRSQRNIAYCTITSPVKGVIIDRKVNIGQTVVSSMNAPSLFLIAKDLKRMEVWVSVNEADIGKIHVGQEVRFTVDALPADEFTGTVGKIRLNASMSQNVVTYIVEVVSENANGKLLPYLTANVQFKVSEHPDVLMVPNAALRWSPANTPSTRRAVWIPGTFSPQQIAVEVIATDGSFTAVQSPDLKEGMEVITSSSGGTTTAAGGVTPFTPSMTHGGKRS